MHLAALLWKLISLASLGVTGYLLMRTLRGGWSWEWAALTCLVFLSSTYFLPLLGRGHNNFTFLLALTAVWWAHHEDRPWLAGVLLGVSVIFKPMPLLLVPLFLIKRHFKTVVATLVTLLGLAMFSLLLVGDSVVVQWFSEMVAFHDRVLHHQFQLSAISLFDRLLAGAHPVLAYGLGAGTMVALYAVSLIVCVRSGGPLRVAEYALVVALVPIASPYVFPHHLALLAFPLLVVLHLLMEEERFAGLRWVVFVVIWLTWALGFYYFQWQTEATAGLKSLLGYVPLFSAIGLWGLLLACIDTRPSKRIMVG